MVVTISVTKKPDKPDKPGKPPEEIIDPPEEIVEPPTEEGWSRVPLGPGGFISGIEAHADGSKIVRMDTSGAYKYNTALSRWDMMVTTTSMPPDMTMPGYGANPGVYEIGIAKSNPLRIYIAWQHLGEWHVMRSDDGGATFMPTNFWAQNPTATWDSNDAHRGAGKKMAIDPANPDVVFVSSRAGVHYTRDGGENWSKVDQLPASSDQINLLAISSGTVYATCYGHGVYRSTDGTNWALVEGGPTTFFDLKIAANGTVWVVAYPVGYQMDVYTLTGSTWTARTTGVGSDGGYLLNGVAIDPTDDNHVVTVTEMGSLSSSFDGGVTWTGYGKRHTDWSPITWLNSIYGGDGMYGLSAGATLVFDPCESNTLLLGTGLGLVKGTAPPSTAQGLAFTQEWAGFSIGLEQLCAKRILKPAGNPDVLLAVMDQGIFNCDGVDYPACKGILPYFSAAWDADSCPSDPLTIVSVINENISFGGPEDQSGISRDGGNTWSAFYGEANGAPYHDYGLVRIGGQIACGATRDNFVICVTGCNPHYTRDGGAHWEQGSFPADFPTTGNDRGWGQNSYEQRHVFCGDRVTAEKFYARNGWAEKFYVSSDGGETWTFLSAPSVGTGMNARLQSVPGHAGHLTYTMGSSGNTNFYGPSLRSIDGGVTWIDLIAVGIKEVICFGFGKPAPGQTYPAVYFIGWKDGVYGIYRSDDAFATWTMIGDYPMGCFDTPVDITGDPDVHGKCYTSIGASGIFKYTPRAHQP